MKRLAPSLALAGAMVSCGIAQAQTVSPIINPINTGVTGTLQAATTTPTTQGVPGYDFRYWKSGAPAAYTACMSGQFVIASLCMNNVTASYGGDPCLATTAAMCKSTDYFESWCGRRAYAANASNTSWLCRTTLQSAAAGYTPPSANTTQRTVSVPQRTQSAAGSLPHALESRTAWVTEAPASSYVERSSFGIWQLPVPAGTTASSPNGSVVTPPMSLQPTVYYAVINPVLAWNLNGNRVASCEEYAYERFYDYHRIDDQVRVARRDPRVFMDAFLAIQGAGYNPTGSQPWNLKDKAGTPMPNHFPSVWFPYNPHYYSGQTDIRETIKNVYSYVNSKLNPVNCGGDVHCALYQAGYGFDHAPTLSWHWQRNAESRQLGYLDEDLEMLKRKQDVLWADYKRWSSTPAGAAKDTLRASLVAQVAEGSSWGCVPADRATRTRCDWAPSQLFDAFYGSPGVEAGFPRGEQLALQRCQKMMNGTAVDDAAMEARFRSIVGRGPASWATINLSTYINKDYTASAAMLEQYFTDIERFQKQLYDALNPDPLTGTALIQSGKKDETVGNEYFGTSVHSLTVGGVDPYGNTSICDADEVFEGHNNVQIQVGGLRTEAFKHDLIRVGSIADNDLSVNGGLIFIPGQAAGGSVSFNYDYPFWSFPLLQWSTPPIFIGPVSAQLRLQADLGFGFRIAASFTGLVRPPHGSSGCTPSEVTTVISGGPYAKAGGSVLLGVALGPLEVGIKGSLSVLDIAVNVTGRMGLQFFSAGPEFSSNLTGTLDLRTLSGTISLYVAINLIVVAIPVFELVLVRFGGIATGAVKIFDLSGIERMDVCLVAQIETLFGSPNRHRPSGCVAEF